MKYMKRIFLVLALFIFSGQLHAAGLRVVSLAPNLTEILFAIGLTEKEIIGITDYCDYPEETKKIPRLGALTTVNIERLVAMGPDYVFSAGSDNSPMNVRLRKAGLNVIVLGPESIEGVFNAVSRMGELTRRDKEAKALIQSMKTRLDAAEGKTTAIASRKKVYIEIWNDPITTCGKNSILDEVVALAGGDNIAKGVNRLYFGISPEFVIMKNPDAIILGYAQGINRDAAGSLLKRPGWQSVNAVRNNNIIADIKPELFLRPGPRIVNGVEEIYRKLYEKD